MAEDAAPLSFSDLEPRLRALPRGATVLLLGGTDTGKTTATRDLVSALAASGLSVAVVDCDLGQSEIGPPGTVGAGLAVAGSAPRSLRDLEPLAGYFVGVTSPTRHLLETCVGAVQVARVARKRRPDLVLVDTDGLVAGPVARLYKRRLAELLLPSVIVALARGDELEPLLTAFARLQSPAVWRVAVAEGVGRKTPAARTTRRAARFLFALEGANPQPFSLDAVSLQGTGLGLGAPVPHHLRQFLSQSLARPVLHAEQAAGGGLYVVVNGDRWDQSGLAAAESYFGTRSVSVVAAQKFAGLLVGLVAPNAGLLALGLIERIDFDRRTLTILTPCRRPGGVAQVWLGGLRLRPDGRELGEVRPGEI